MIERIGRIFCLLPDFDSLRASLVVHAKLVAHQKFHVRYLLSVHGAVGLRDFGTQRKNVVQKLALPALIGFEFGIFRGFFSGLVEQKMPGQRTHNKPDEATKRDAHQVEQKNANKPANDFASEFQSA